MEKPLVSIIVPCYQQEKYVSETLESVRSQTYEKWECIVVDDGSKDNSAKIVSGYVNRDKRIKLIRQQNRGVSNARNNAINYSKGKYILPLDADDIIAPSYLEKAVKIMEDNPDYTLVYCKADRFGLEKGLWSLPEYSYDTLLWKNIIFCSALFRRKDFEITHGYNENMIDGLEDWDFWLSLLSKDSIVYQINEVLFHYRIKTSSRTDNAVQSFPSLCKRIFLNHTDLYQEYVPDIIYLHNKVGIISHENTMIRTSISYRVGRAIVAPFGKILDATKRFSRLFHRYFIRYKISNH